MSDSPDPSPDGGQNTTDVSVIEIVSDNERLDKEIISDSNSVIDLDSDSEVSDSDIGSPIVDRLPD